MAAVTSIREQQQRAAEIIVVVDHEPRLLARARGAFDDVEVVSNRYQRGLSGARNTGIEMSRSDVIAFLDDDARAERDWLSVLLTAFDRPSVVAAGGRAIPAWADGQRPSWMPAAFDWVVGCSYDGLPEHPAAVRNVLGCNMAFRADSLREAGGFASRLGRTATSANGAEETEVCIRLRQRDPGAEVVYVPAAVVQHSVPLARATWRYFALRCLAEGRSKAILSSMVGSEAALESERRYVSHVLPRAAGRAIAGAVRNRRPTLLMQVVAIVAGLALTGAGYLSGRITGRRAAETVR